MAFRWRPTCCSRGALLVLPPLPSPLLPPRLAVTTLIRTHTTGTPRRAPKTTGAPPERRVLLFTNNDQPAVADLDGNSALKHRVDILREQGHHVDLMGLVRPRLPCPALPHPPPPPAVPSLSLCSQNAIEIR